jgi:DNA-binding protein H-NS
VAEAEVIGEQQRREAEQAAKKIAELERRISTLQEAIAKAEALGEQQHQKAQRQPSEPIISSPKSST